jgi:hypothetical protein
LLAFLSPLLLGFHLLKCAIWKSVPASSLAIAQGTDTYSQAICEPFSQARPEKPVNALLAMKMTERELTLNQGLSLFSNITRLKLLSSGK